MNFKFLSLFVVLVSIAGIWCNVDRLRTTEKSTLEPTWGKISEPSRYQIGILKTKFPLISRCSTFKYPDDLVCDVYLKYSVVDFE